MTQVGVTTSPTLFSLLEKGALNIDYIKVDADRGMEVLTRALKYKPVLLHDVSNKFWLNYENPFDETIMATARTLLDTAGSKWFSTGIGASAEPQGHTLEYWRGADVSQLQSRETVIANVLRNGRRLKEWAGVPLLLENYNYHPTNAYEYICEPELFSDLTEAIGCGVLLDLAHAQISAHNMGWGDPRRYLEALPLRKVREIHVNHPGSDGKQMLDRHFPLQDEDLGLLAWTLAHCPAESVTLESESPDEETLLGEIARLRRIILT